MNWIKEKFQSAGIHKKDVPSAILLFKGLGYTTWFGLLFTCYRFKPVQRFFKLPVPNRWLTHIKTKHQVKYDSWHSWVMTKSEKLANWRFFKPIPTTLGLKSKRFVIALAQTTILYKLMLPVLLPLQVGGVVYFYRHRAKPYKELPKN